jgi:hypothetical protein
VGIDPIDQAMMARCIELSKIGAAAGELPFGSLVARHGQIIAEASNQVVRLVDESRHAEIIATRREAHVLREQVSTRRCSAQAIMRHRNIARDLEDIRTGRPFDDRIEDKYWAYDRGRLFGAIAPLSMALKVGRALNPVAVALLVAAFERRWVIWNRSVLWKSLFR